MSGGDYRIRIVDIMDKTYYCFSEYFRIVSDILPGTNSTTPPLETSRQWDIYTIDTGNVGFYSSIDVDNQNRPHISYYDAASDDLKYAYWNGSAWDIDLVDGQGSNRGEYTSIALDSYGNPHISYINGDVGGNCSMVLDDAGYLHISYADYSNGVLKYATIEIVDIEEDTRQTNGFPFQIMPNPSHAGQSMIRYGLAKSDNVSIIVYNTLGQAIRTLVNKKESAGMHTVLWDGNDYSGTEVSAGVYFLKYETGDYTETKKLLLLK